MKLCKHCKHWVEIEGTAKPEYDECNFTQEIEPVRGIPYRAACQDVRNDCTLCGPDAKWFQPRLTSSS